MVPHDGAKLHAITLPVTPESGLRAETNTNRTMVAAGLHEVLGEPPAGVNGSPNWHMRRCLFDRDMKHDPPGTGLGPRNPACRRGRSRGRAAETGARVPGNPAERRLRPARL